MGFAARHSDADGPAPPASESTSNASFLQRNAALVAVAGFWLLVLVLALPQELVQDSWLTLVSGREVVQHGLPHVDGLAMWTHGARWIDQQWLAQLFFYGLYAAAGIRAVVLAHVVLLTIMFCSGLAAARSLGASRASVVAGGLASLSLAPWAMQLRAQTLAECFFVCLVWLLAADSRAPSRRVFLALPLLVLWANVHGTAVLGAGLVVLRGLTGLADRRRPTRSTARTLLLVGAPFVCIFVSPYGVSLADYYHRLLANPTLRWFIDEWGPSTPSHKTVLFFVLAAVTIWLLGRFHDRLTRFEQLALVLTLVGGVTAIRSIIWFALAALVLLPLLLDGALERLSFERLERAARPAVPALLVAVAATAAYGATRPTSWYEQAWPTKGARAVIHSLSCRASTRVFADDRYADWLLWTEPETRGRIAYDVRFELFRRPDFLRLYEYRNRVGKNWTRAAHGYNVVLFDPRQQLDIEQGMLARPKVRRWYRDGGLSILGAGPAPALASSPACTRIDRSFAAPVHGRPANPSTR
jgi:hypothetical protein